MRDPSRTWGLIFVPFSYKIKEGATQKNETMVVMHTHTIDTHTVARWSFTRENGTDSRTLVSVCTTQKDK
jgi:hypothetical protein